MFPQNTHIDSKPGDVMDVAKFLPAKADPLLYPGCKPTRNDFLSGYLIDRKTKLIHILDIPDISQKSDLVSELGKISLFHGEQSSELSDLVPNIGKLLPMLGYGTLTNPNELIERMGKVGEEGRYTIVLPGYLFGFDVVASQISPRGRVPADLVLSPGAYTDTGITLVSGPQFEVLYGLESHMYEPTEFGVHIRADYSDKKPNSISGFKLNTVGFSTVGFSGYVPAFNHPEDGEIGLAEIKVEGRQRRQRYQHQAMAEVATALNIQEQFPEFKGLEGTELARGFSDLILDHNEGSQYEGKTRKPNELVKVLNDRLLNEGLVSLHATADLLNIQVPSPVQPRNFNHAQFYLEKQGGI